MNGKAINGDIRIPRYLDEGPGTRTWAKWAHSS